MTSTLLTAQQARTLTQTNPATDTSERRMVASIKSHIESGYCYVYAHLPAHKSMANRLAAKRLRKQGYRVNLVEDAHGTEVYFIWWGSLRGYLWYRLRVGYYSALRNF